MPKEPKYKLIEEETLRELLSTQFQLSYSIILLSYICQRNKPRHDPYCKRSGWHHKIISPPDK